MPQIILQKSFLIRINLGSGKSHELFSVDLIGLRAVASESWKVLMLQGKNKTDIFELNGHF